MASNINHKKALAEQIKVKLNSPEYVAMPDLITHDDLYGDMLAWLWGNKIDGNIHKKDNWITGTDINPGKGNKHESEHMVCYDELEKDDWGEIVNLIEKRNEEKKQLYEQKRSKIKENLNNTSNLYYRFSTSERISTGYFTYPDKHGRYFHIWGVENGREFYLNINANHPVLNNFPWQKNGYYLIETDKLIERNDEFGRPWSDYGEDNPSNFHKWVEVDDKITITPYETADKPVEKPIKKDNSKVDMPQIAGSKKDNSNQPIKKITNEEERKIIELLTQYFKDNQIKEVKLANNELVITHNNNETTTDSSEYQIKNSLKKINKNELTSQELGINFDASTNTNNSQPNNDNYLWLVGGIAVGAVLAGIFWVLYLSRQRKSKK